MTIDNRVLKIFSHRSNTGITIYYSERRNMKTVSFKLDEDFLNELEALAGKLHENKSSLIKKALAFYIDNYDGIIAKTRNEDPEKELIPHEDVLKKYGLL